MMAQLIAVLIHGFKPDQKKNIESTKISERGKHDKKM